MTPPAHPRPLPDGPLGVEVRGVRRRYDDQLVLDGVTFDVAPSESVAIVGQTGVGKSTLSQLLVRLADPDDGRVAIGGVDLREADPASLRRSTAIVFQESFLFSTNVRENIALDSGADRRARWRPPRNRLGRPVHPRAPRRVRHGGGRARPHALRRRTPARGARPRDRARAARADPGRRDLGRGPLDRGRHPGRAARELPHHADRGGLPAVDDPARRPRDLPGGRAGRRRPGTHEELLATMPGYAAIIHAYEQGER